MTIDERYDVVVVGGGTGGLGAALTLARARRSVLVVDAGTPRNEPATQVHNFLGRDGTPPAELGAIGRGEVERHGGTVIPGRVAALQQEDGGFRVDLADGRAGAASAQAVGRHWPDRRAARPSRNGRTLGNERPARPYCHGWEVKDQAIGVLGSGPLGTFQALLWRQWSDDVVLFRHTGPAPTPEELQRLTARGIRIVEGEVAGLDATDGALAGGALAGGALAGVRLTSGEVVARDALVVAPRFIANADLLADLGIKPVDQVVHGTVRGTHVPADPTGLTEVPGVWVVGNLADVTAQVMASAVQGMNAAAAINVDLLFEDTRLAVEKDARARSAETP